MINVLMSRGFCKRNPDLQRFIFFDDRVANLFIFFLNYKIPDEGWQPFQSRNPDLKRFIFFVGGGCQPFKILFNL